MKRPISPIGIVLVLIGAVALAGFVVSPALGGPGFLTTQQARKLFVGKGQARTFVRKREAAGLLRKADADTRSSSPVPKPTLASCPPKG